MITLQSLHDTTSALITGTQEQAAIANPGSVMVVVVDGTPAHERGVQSVAFDVASGYLVLTVDPID